jgi:aminoglycoside phosphotransferase (APT) family kinase protein
MSGETSRVPSVELSLVELEERLHPLPVGDIRRLPGGASSLTYRGTLGDGRPVVVKVAPAGLDPVLNRDVLRQARLLRAIAGSGVPVPEVLWEHAGEPPNVPPLFVMSLVPGTSFEPLFDPDDGGDVTTVAERMRNAAGVMTALHTVDPQAAGLGVEPVVGPAEEVARWSRALGTVDSELAPNWDEVALALGQAVPAARPPRVVHGDYRLGNMLATGPTITAIIDWEIWTIGDPRVDLGWFLVNADPDTYRRPTRYAGRLPSPDELAAIYGDSPDLYWFQALACFKSAATIALIVKHNRRRPDPDPGLEAMADDLPHLLDRSRSLLAV